MIPFLGRQRCKRMNEIITPLPEYTSVTVDQRIYNLEVYRRVSLPYEYPRLVIVAYQPNPMASKILNTCLQTIHTYTSTPYELWVVDNDSPKKNSEWLYNQPGINLVLNHTHPIPPQEIRFWHRWRYARRQQKWGSYANAIGLELAIRLINPQTRFLMPIHMDTMPCHPDWINFLMSKLNHKIAASGVLLQTNRVPGGVLHVLGYVVDFQLFQKLELDFLPDLPNYDVGDRVTVELRRVGYDVYGCQNTFTEPELVKRIPVSSPFRNLPVFRALDEQGHVIFLHLGRGIRKTTGQHRRGVTPDEWVEFAQKYLLDTNDKNIPEPFK